MNKTPENTAGRKPDDLDWLDSQISPETLRLAKEMRADLDVAQAVYDARKEAGLTQKQLAEKMETTQSVISQLESADYEGHSLSMLRKVAEATGKLLVVQFVDNQDMKKTA